MARVGSLDLTDGDTSILDKAAESITRLDSVLAVGARAARADRDVGLVAGEDAVEAGEPAGVGGLEGIKLKVEVVGDESKGVVGDDLVLRVAVGGHTLDAVLGTGGLERGGSCGKAAGLVDGTRAVGWDDKPLADIDEVGVADVVVLGNVAGTRIVLVGDGGQGIT